MYPPEIFIPHLDDPQLAEPDVLIKEVGGDDVAGQAADDCVKQHTPVEKKLNEKKQEKYEIYIQVEETVSGKLLDGIEFLMQPSTSSFSRGYTSAKGGQIRIEVNDNNKEYVLQFQLKPGLKYTWEKRVDTVKSQPVNGKPYRLILETTVLHISKVDHHFVPTGKADAENLEITYGVKKVSKERVFLRIHSAAHNPSLLYEHELSDSEKSDGSGKILKWDGKTNCLTGELKDKLISPPYGPFEITLESPSLKLKSDTENTLVLCRSLEAVDITWADVYKAATSSADDQYPASAAQLFKAHWLQYRLNKLGYPAGRLTALGAFESLIRGIYHYSQDHPKLPYVTHFETRKSAPGKYGWGWVDEWEKAFGRIDDFISMPAHPESVKLLNELKKEDQKIKDTLENPGVLKSMQDESRVILDHNIFYLNKDYLEPDAHAEYDQEFLNPWSVPLSVKVYLVSRNDPDGTGNGVFAPGATTGLTCEWYAFDPSEDLRPIPPPLNNGIEIQSKSKAFVQKVLKASEGNPSDLPDRQDNCPEEYGGKRGDQGDMRPYFSGVDNLYNEEKLHGDAKRFFTSFNTDETNSWGMPGTSGAQFETSYIAGDNYVVQARISFDTVSDSGRKSILVGEHKKLRGLVLALNAGTRFMTRSADDPLAVQTGKMTVWRRQHVLREVHWSPQAYPEIKWMPVVDNFRAAHVILVPPKEPPVNIADLFDNATQQAILNALIKNPPAETEAKTEFLALAAKKRFSRKELFPVPVRTFAEFEKSPMKKTNPQDETVQYRVKAYHDYILGIIGKWPKYDFLVDAAREIREGFNKLKKGPGLIILRLEYIAQPDFQSLMPPDIYKKTCAMNDEFKFIRALGTGMDYGVVMLDKVNYDLYDEAYFVSHEIAHCLFLNHPFDMGMENHHDQEDKNCLMYYADKNAVGSHQGNMIGWAAKKAPQSFSLRIDIDFGKTVNSKDGPSLISGGFKNFDRGAEGFIYTASGSIASLNKELQKVKFERHKTIGIHTVAEVVLEMTAGRMNPLIDGNRTFPVRKYSMEKSFHPFADIKLKEPELKQTKPLLCGKCLLKLRGWRVVEDIAKAGKIYPPPPPVAIPVKPKMLLYSVKTTELHYSDPANKRQVLSPGKYLHAHTINWKSSSGKKGDLDQVYTREHVKYDRNTQDAPFNDWADPDQEFWFSGKGRKDGVSVKSDNPGILGQSSNTDVHSMMSGSLICRYPLQEGALKAVQWYEYSLDANQPRKWQHMPEAAYILEKSVRKSGNDYLIIFKKTNHPDHNPRHFHFEVHYKIGAQINPYPHDSLKELPDDGGRPGLEDKTIERIFGTLDKSSAYTDNDDFDEKMKVLCVYFRLEQ